MNDCLSFVVYGAPKAQPRARAYRRGAHAGIYNPSTADTWKALIIAAARACPDFPASPLEGPRRVDIAWFLPRPQRLLRRCAPDWPLPYHGKPDRDNLDKAVLDALVQAGLLRDDAQAVQGHLAKWYAEKGGTPRAVIRVSPADPWQGR